MRYLVVDDETAICQGTARRLRRFLPAEAEISCAYSGEQALSLIESGAPDILITDIRMGSMDGLTLIERARALREDVACIIVTAFDSFRYAQRAIKLGVTEYLVKPYSEGDLREAVERAEAALRKERGQNRAFLEKQVYELMLGGGRAEENLFTRAGLAAPPKTLRVCCWEGEAGDPMPGFPGEWHFLDARRQYLLFGDDRAAVSRWAEALPGLRFGVSLAGEELGELWRQAGAALRLSGTAGMPALVFWQADFADETRMKQDHAVLWAVHYVGSHVGEPITMEAVCAQLHLNYSYFSRQFKQQMGVSFSEYLLREQMRWACAQLEAGMRVGEAALQLGYGSSESFGKAFSRVYGSTPRNYLASQKEKKP